MGGNQTFYRVLYTTLLLIIFSFLGIKIYSGQWLQTELQGLLPKEQHWTEIQQIVDKQQEQQLNRQFIGLVGHIDPTIAFSTAKSISKEWQQSQLFSYSKSQILPKITQLQQDIKTLSIATLPIHIRQQLLTNPQEYFQQYAQQIIDPFGQTNLLSIEQDWLGFGRFSIEQGKILPQIQWNSENGMLYIKQNDITWVLLQAELTQGDLINTQQSLLHLIKQNQQTATQAKAQFLSAGSALFAAYAKQDAERESTLMSSLSISLTLLLLIFTFRTIRIFWLFLPILLGMASGIGATIFVFGKIHILTLVVGTSLIGVLIDFPLHWLSSSLFSPQWQGQKAMNKLRLSFLISLIVTLLGYALLGFTILPVLQQTALFSSIALISAICCTLFYLPPLFTHYQPRKRVNFLQNLHFSFKHRTSWILGISLCVFIIFGLSKSKWQDDIRQWVAMPQELTKQLQQINQITGIEFGSQYFLITAKNSDDLLVKSRHLSEKLNTLQQQGKIGKFQSLNQWILSKDEQTQFAKHLIQNITPQHYQILTKIGIPQETIENAFESLSNQPTLSLEQALQTQFGQGWQPLYIGKITPNLVAGLIKVSNAINFDEIISLANQKDIFWQDKRAHLNNTFQQTQEQAIWLKAFSFLLAGGILWKIFGLKPTLKILIIPFISILTVIASFSYLSQPIGLFTTFGLLLVSAISIDYTVYMHTVEEPLVDKRITILLAATTTIISFILLGFSSTPAIANFGFSVSLGIAFSLVIIFNLFK